MVRATERNAGARVISAFAVSVTAPGRLLAVNLRPCAVAAGAWVLAELDVFAVGVEEVEGPAMGPGETVRV